MARYSVATTKDQLSSLIDKAMAGEEVVITRHGAPVVQMRRVDQAAPVDNVAAMEELRRLRASLPQQTASSAELIRAMRDEGLG